MAIYRFEAKIISRGAGRSAAAAASYRSGKFANNGKSAVSAAAYRAGAKLVDSRTGTTYDYSGKGGVLGAEIMVPDGTLPFLRERQELWAMVERMERRKDSTLARDFILSLPHELTHEQRVALTRDFVRSEFCAKGFIADIAWHAPGKRSDERNFHAHVMIPTRVIENGALASRKHRPAGNEHPAKAWAAELMNLRIAWANTANRHLEAAGLDLRIDHRSLSARGVDREPESKIGPVANAMEAKGFISRAGNDNRDIRARNAERVLLKVELAAAAAEEARILDLITHRLRSGEMAIRDEDLRQQPEREAERLRTLAEQDARIQAFKKQKEHEAEEAKRKQERNGPGEERRDTEGGIADPKLRYAKALGDHYDIRNPYGSLARAAMSEYSAFLQQQHQLKAETARESDPTRRRVIELRKEIEAHDYMAITSDRLAGMSATIAGREDAPQAKLDRARATAYAERGAELRQERRELMAEQERQSSGRPAGAARPGQPVEPDSPAAPHRAEPRKREEREAADAKEATPSRKEADGELSDTQREQLERLNATREAYATHAAQRQQARDRGGGRSR